MEELLAAYLARRINITDKTALFKDFGLRLAFGAAVGYPIRAIDFNTRCSLKYYQLQTQLNTQKTLLPLLKFGQQYQQICFLIAKIRAEARFPSEFGFEIADLYD